MNGADLLVAARLLGHSDTRMVERHYGHLRPPYVDDAVRALSTAGSTGAGRQGCAPAPIMVAPKLRRAVTR